MADELYDRQYNNDEIWGLNYEEIGEVMCKDVRIPAHTDPIKLKIRTILPPQLDDDPSLIPKDWNELLTDAIYCNDIRCKTKVSGGISKKNYIMVKGNTSSE